MTSADSSQTKQRVLLALMWVAAIGASWGIYRARQPDAADTVQTIAVSTPAVEGKPQRARPAVAPSLDRLDPRHTGRSPFVGPARGVVRFRVELGARVTAQPVIDATGDVIVGTHAGVLWKLNSEGVPRWRQDLGARIYAAAAVADDGSIVVGTDGKGVLGLTASGQPRFRMELPVDADTAPVLASDGSIRVAAGRTLYALEPDGRVRFQHETSDVIFGGPMVDDDGTTYFGTQDGHVCAVDAAGKQRFAYRTGGAVSATPALDADGTLYIGADDQHVYAISTTGALRWSQRLDGAVRSPVAIAERLVLATSFGPRPALAALDRATGEARFRFSFGLSDGPDSGVRGGPIVDAQGNIYVGAEDDYLYALTPDGKLRWTLSLGTDVEASPVLAPDGTLYAVSLAGELYAIGGNTL